ncbi:MAG TPA: carbonic anhydrase [Nitrospirota bacterium]|nr:carbonic anhydrase [Nitrospirota bacterium]
MFRKSTFVVLVAAVVLFVGLSFAFDRSGDEALGRLMDGNKRFISGALAQKGNCRAKRQDLVAGQHPAAIVVACSDSRVAPEVIFDQFLGDVFVIRVAGNVLDPVGLGSIEYAAEHLHAPLLVMMGHDKCGAVAATLDATGKPGGNIGAIVAKILPAVEKARTKGGTRDQVLDTAVRENVLDSHASLLKQSPALKHLVEKGGLKIVDAVYHLASGEVEILPAVPAPAMKSHTH